MCKTEVDRGAMEVKPNYITKLSRLLSLLRGKSSSRRVLAKMRSEGPRDEEKDGVTEEGEETRRDRGLTEGLFLHCTISMQYS